MSVAVALTTFQFAMGLVTVFVPLLLLQHGAALWQMCLFYVVYSWCKLAINYPSALVINRLGARVGLIIGFLSAVSYLLLLAGLVSGAAGWAVYAAPFGLALMNSFLWNSQHLHISRVMDAERRSRDMAIIASFGRLADLAAPLVGSGLVAVGGQTTLLLVAIALVLAAIVPTRRIDMIAGGHQPQASVRYSLKFASRKDLIANFSFNAHNAIGTMVWPIYLAYVLASFTSIGLVSTAATALSLALLIPAGRRGDRGKSRQVLLEGTLLSSIFHLARPLATGPLAVTLVSAGNTTAGTYQFNPWVSYYYDHSRHGGINYIMSLEIAGDIAYLSVWALLLLFSLGTGSASRLFFYVAFIAAGIFTWGCMFIASGHAQRRG